MYPKATILMLILKWKFLSVFFFKVLLKHQKVRSLLMFNAK